MSTLATIIGGLGELTESELRQLYLLIGVRLGIPDVPTGALPQGRKSVINGETGSTTRKTSGSIVSSKGKPKGNPQRKSQWAKHPQYQEYTRLKKVVSTLAKEKGISFNAVDTAESREYRLAFNLWLEAKYSFRDHRASGGKQAMPAEKEHEEMSTGPAKPAPIEQRIAVSSRPSQSSGGKSAPAHVGRTGKSRNSSRKD